MDEPSEAELAAFHRTVGRLRALPPDHPDRLRAERVAESFARDGRRRRRKAIAKTSAAADAALSAATATGGADREPDAALHGTGLSGSLSKPRRCYVCKGHFRQIEGFYHLLCPTCAAENAARRAARTDLTGRRALLTGGRVKIGFELALMMLGDGAEVTVTTRFPHDARRRFAAADGHQSWRDRLHVIGIDLRDPRQIIGLTERFLADGRGLDILVNNAAQTIRRPPESYTALAAAERAALDAPGTWLAPGFQVPEPNTLPASIREDLVPSAAVPIPDASGLLPDPAPENSWSKSLGGLDPAETLEAYLVNAFAPTLLCDRLLPLLLASRHQRRYIVNVSAVEGRFNVRHKTSRHPHTNMAKAALNMLTRTSGPALAERGVYMCAVDTGWITDEHPAPVKARSAERGFRTPLDVVDGAARVYDPIVRGEAGHPLAGVFLKDYREAAW
jgi:NAD(P)-dependent dehydrogenase (short-subunit alcohol dehydrogenase family)